MGLLGVDPTKSNARGEVVFTDVSQDLADGLANPADPFTAQLNTTYAPLASPTLSNPTLTGTVTVPDGALAIADTSGLQGALDAETTRATASAAAFSLVFGG